VVLWSVKTELGKRGSLWRVCSGNGTLVGGHAVREPVRQAHGPEPFGRELRADRQRRGIHGPEGNRRGGPPYGNFENGALLCKAFSPPLMNRTLDTESFH
jgi:hypothetical protein